MESQMPEEAMPITRRQILRGLPLCKIEGLILYRDHEKDLALEILEDCYKDACFWKNKFGINSNIRTQGNPVIRACNIRGLPLEQIEELIFGRHQDADLAFGVIEDSYTGIQRRISEIASGNVEKPDLARNYQEEFPRNWGEL